MKASNLPNALAAIVSVVAFAPALIAQTTSVQLFQVANTRSSQSTASYSDPDTFNTTTLSLSCTESPITATLSGPLMNNAGTAPLLANGALQPGGNLLVDNNILMSVTSQSGTTPPANICLNGYNSGGEGLYSQNCFNLVGYGDYAYTGVFNGQNPDTFIRPGTTQTVDAAGGVPPINLSSSLVSGSQSVTIGLVDEGGFFTSSTLFLTTNCSQGGVTGPAQVTGNTITSTPTPGQLLQNFTFNTNSNQNIGFVYNLAGAQNAGSLTINGQGVTPVVADYPIDPATFQNNFLSGTSFATSTCIIHNGEVGGPSSQPACKLFTLECTTGTGNQATGAQCPVSTLDNEVIEDIFDGPVFNLQDIPTIVNNVSGPTFHQGFGLLMASEGWGSENGGTWDWDGGPAGACTFDAASGLQSLLCPENLLSSFSGPGLTTGSGQTTHPNSSFISIFGIPEDLTTVTVTDSGGNPASLGPGNWTNNPNVYVSLSSQPPDVAHASPALPNAANFVAAPIQTISYGLTPAASLPQPINEPIAADTVLTNSVPCPSPSSPGNPSAAVFNGGVQNLNLANGDGNYLLHYYARDCAGTQELQFTNTASDGSGIWATNFYTFPINLDTVPPVVSAIALSPPGGSYSYGQTVTASYTCTDDRSGVVNCGGQTFAPGTLTTGTLTVPVPTTSNGSQTFTVTAADAAGNQATPQSVGYSISGLVPLTVTANNASRAVGAANPAFTVSYSGFLPGQNASVLGGSPAFSTKATASSPVGTYPIAVTQGTLSSPTYSFTFVNGTLSVVQPPSAILTTTAVLSGSAQAGYVATVTVTNTGAGAAANVQLTSASLGSALGSTLPQNLGTLAAGGGSATAIINFPGSAGGNGAGVAEKIAGTYTGGSFSASVRSALLP